MKKYLIIFIIAVISSIPFQGIFAAYPTETDDSPFSVYYFGLGSSGSTFPKNSSTWKNISFSIDPNDHVIGGSFDGMESSIRASLTTNIDRKSNFMLPISYEYMFMRAGELIYYNLTPQINYHGTFHHKIDVQKFSIGVDWQAIQTPYKDVKIYLGLDAKAFLVTNQEFTRQDVRIQNDSTVQIDKFPYIPKENAFRMGGEGKIGFRGHLINKFYINTFIGYEVFNLICRDDKRGQLFTPFSKYEPKEDLITAWHYFLSIEYKF